MNGRDFTPGENAFAAGMTPHRGELLVAQPLLTESVFSRAVILLVDVDEPDRHLGSMGLVLNKKLENLTMGDVLPGWEKGKEIPIYIGGPVEHERLFILHSLGSRFGHTVEIGSDLYIGANLDMVKEYVDQGGTVEGKMRFFLGYSGWDRNQLENELRQNVWALTPRMNPRAIFKDSDLEYWRREVESLGEDFRHWLLIPEHPEWN